MCALHAGSTPVGGSAYRKHAAGISMERKRLCRGHQSKVVKCLCWKAELYPYPATPSPSLSPCFFFPCFPFFTLFASADCGVLFSLLSREMRLTCRGLKGICSASSMHRVTFAVDSTSIKFETDRRANKDTLQCAHSLCCSR